MKMSFRIKFYINYAGDYCQPIIFDKCLAFKMLLL